MTLSPAMREALARAKSDRIVYDLAGIADRYDCLVRQLPGVAIRFAMKACPVDEVIADLAARGAGCDAASPNEILQALGAGLPVERIHYGNTSKSDDNIADAYRIGVRDFATDSLQDVTAIAEYAPGSRVFCRLVTTGEGALWGLSRKFGCSVADAVLVLERARELGLVPAGLSVHVGSQQMRAEAWTAAFADMGQAIAALEQRGIGLQYVNLGGGLPALGYLDRRGNPLDPPLDEIFAAIRVGMRRLTTMSSTPLRFLAEPGRYLVADHGAIRAHVQRLSERELTDGERQHWLYLSVGKYNGLYEMDELQYRLVFPTHEEDGTSAGELVPAVVAGPTCDSDDAYVHEDNFVHVPAALASGDPVWIVSCGAYSTSYTTQGFNGIDPLEYQWIRGPRVRPIADDDWESIAELEFTTYSELGLSEGRAALESRARRSPETSFVLELDRKVAGYVVALPYPSLQYPDLHRPEEEFALTAEGTADECGGVNLHLHDLVVAEGVRGRGLAKLLLRRLESIAIQGRRFATISLVSVGDSEGFWAAAGYRPQREVGTPEGYGSQSVYMSKALEVDPLAACPR